MVTDNEIWTAFPIVPENAPEPEHFPKHEALYTYKNQENYLLGYTMRIVRKNGKTVLPYCYCHSESGKQEWRFKRWENPLPMYNMQRLHGAASVVIVEGEKCADAMQAMCPPKCCAVAWPGGTNAYNHVDWVPIYGKKVLLWPDHDLPGYEAMSKIARVLVGKCDIKILRPPQDKPQGWDCANAFLQDGWEQKTTFDFIRSNIITENDLSKLIDKIKTPNTTPVITDDAPFVFLGYNRGHYYYHPRGTEQITALTAPEHSANYLFTMAKKEFWIEHFASKLGIDWKSAIDWLYTESHKVGIYDVMRVRGCGVWVDDGRTVVHDGENLSVNGKKTALSQIKSSKIYEREVKKSLIDADPLPFSEAAILLEICQSLLWENPLSAYLLAGWAVIAPLCGAQTWRPHIQLTGSAGTGKTYVVDHIIKPLLGDAAAYTTVGTTAAGILQNLKSSAFPVLVDEAEAKTQYSSQNIQAILDLMRQASSDSEAKTMKGTVNGTGIQYCVRSCFCLASIGVSVDEDADKGRVSVLTLAQDHRENRREIFKTLHKTIVTTLKTGWCSGFRSRSIQNLKTILANISVFSDVAAIKLGTQRKGDQIGALLGAAFTLVADTPVTKEIATNFLESWDWEAHQTIDQESDENHCLQTILQYPIAVNTVEKRFDISVAEAINWVLRENTTKWGEKSPPLPAEEFNLILRRYGIRIDTQKKLIYISSSNQLLKKILKDTRWNKNWCLTLRRIPGATESVTCRFAPGIITRAVGVPIIGDWDVED